jgi:hypothetical protein
MGHWRPSTHAEKRGSGRPGATSSSARLPTLAGAMTTYAWAQLKPGSYGLPGPAVVMNRWVLAVPVPRPRRRGLTRVTRPSQWPSVRAARRIIVDYPDPWDVLVVGAQQPDTVDGDARRNLTPGGWSSGGGVDWCITTAFRGPTAQAFHDLVHRADRLLLRTGDLATYWSARRAGTIPTFEQLFPDGCWAVWAPLQVHLYDDGVGTRPD